MLIIDELKTFFTFKKNFFYCCITSSLKCFPIILIILHQLNGSITNFPYIRVFLLLFLFISFLVTPPIGETFTESPYSASIKFFSLHRQYNVHLIILNMIIDIQ